MLEVLENVISVHQEKCMKQNKQTNKKTKKQKIENKNKWFTELRKTK